MRGQRRGAGREAGWVLGRRERGRGAPRAPTPSRGKAQLCGEDVGDSGPAVQAPEDRGAGGGAAAEGVGAPGKQRAAEALCGAGGARLSRRPPASSRDAAPRCPGPARLLSLSGPVSLARAERRRTPRAAGPAESLRRRRGRGAGNAGAERRAPPRPPSPRVAASPPCARRRERAPAPTRPPARGRARSGVLGLGSVRLGARPESPPSAPRPGDGGAEDRDAPGGTSRARPPQTALTLAKGLGITKYLWKPDGEKT
ncbi:uncharacterized protein LOC131420303 [Diceros bicornis minor]|uniref:uncharacterized protein LOC131420303 n=1 Tax=Diceros bicornis minor TaxID=77932 RepID=UPI0026F1F365|nr:uncharacterized protein LOC131420303 [Diceros bicornis minor]